MIGSMILSSGVAAPDAVRAMKAEAVQIEGRDHLGIFTKLGPADPAFDRMVAFVSKR